MVVVDGRVSERKKIGKDKGNQAKEEKNVGIDE